MGETFRSQASQALKVAKVEPYWEERKKNSQLLLSLSQPLFPQYFEELQGYAHGANIDFLDFWTLALEDDSLSNLDSVSISEHAKCTTAVINDGFTLVHSEDHFEPGLEESICLIKKQIGNFSSFEIFYYNTLGGSSVGFNSNGFAQAINTLLNTPIRIGVPKNLLARYLFDTNDPAASFNWLKTLRIGSGFSHLIIDPHGRIYNIEFSVAQSLFIEKSSPHYHTNHCLLTEGYPTQDDYGTLSRLEYAQSHITEDVDTDLIPQLVQDQSLGADKSIHNERTIAQMIIDQHNQSARVWLKREKEMGWIEYSL